MSAKLQPPTSISFETSCLCQNKIQLPSHGGGQNANKQSYYAFVVYNNGKNTTTTTATTHEEVAKSVKHFRLNNVNKPMINDQNCMYTRCRSRTRHHRPVPIRTDGREVYLHTHPNLCRPTSVLRYSRNDGCNALL